jgi:WD40 repeat protein
VEYLGDGRCRIAGLTAGLDDKLRAFRRKLPTRSQTGKIEIKPGQTTDAGELRLEWEEALVGDAQPRFRLEHDGQVDQVAFSPDGATLASISPSVSVSDSDDYATLADIATGKVLQMRRIPAVCMAFFPKSDRLALGCRDGTVVLTNEKKLTTWKSFSVSNSGAYPVAVSPNGAMIACHADDRTVGCWDVMSGRKMHTLAAKGIHMTGLAFSPDNKLLLAVDQRGLCMAWDLESEKELGSFPTVNSYISGPVSICFCPDGKTAAIALFGAEPLRFWDPRGGKPPVLVSLPDAIQPKSDSTSPKDGPVKGPGPTVLSPDCKMAATVLESGWVAVWDIPSRRVFQVLPANEGFARQGLAFSPDGRLLATSNSQGVEVWEIDAARDAKKSETRAVALPEFLKTNEEHTTEQ